MTAAEVVVPAVISDEASLIDETSATLEIEQAPIEVAIDLQTPTEVANDSQIDEVANDSQVDEVANDSQVDEVIVDSQDAVL